MALHEAPNADARGLLNDCQLLSARQPHRRLALTGVRGWCFFVFSEHRGFVVDGITGLAKGTLVFTGARKKPPFRLIAKK